MPDIVEAIFITHDETHARNVHQGFLEYFGLHAPNLPLLWYNPGGQQAFSLVDEP